MQHLFNSEENRWLNQIKSISNNISTRDIIRGVLEFINSEYNLSSLEIAYLNH